VNTLIIYATKHGSTEGCASELSKKLKGSVELCNLKAGTAIDIEKYHKIIIGGSIYGGRIQKEISEFCMKNLNVLKDKKVGLFICCMFKNNAEAQLTAAFPQELFNSAVARASFGGEMRFSDMSFAEKLITKMVSKTIAKSDESLSGIDGKKDVSMIVDESINKFAEQMNSI
jgi:menaquinone-dependent protoporphyrinogen oxidase